MIDYLITIYDSIKSYLFGTIEEEEDEIPEPMMILESDYNLGKPDDNPKSVGYTKYIIYSLMLATVGAVVIIYHEEIYESGLAAWDWLVNSFRTGEDPGNNPGGNNPTNNAGGDRPDIQTIIIEGAQPSSPVSDTSVETIKPSYPVAESSTSIADSINIKIERASKIIEENKVLFHEKFASVDYWSDNWKNWLHKDMKQQILNVDNLISSEDLMIQNTTEITDSFVTIIRDYNAQVDILQNSDLNSDALDKVNKVLRHIKKWISDTNYVLNNKTFDDTIEKIEISELISKTEI